ncbi:LLM class flavin-dependent oxidoreductase [Candidatus Amarobacter glycogenicus]|uniref:LLM class flavin-dependent oxidoreductase n=1 Tax=Candidatus Amarobacter glycogenicus TaxID=3140699 RepID=UPI003134C3CA|nr:LLM class flavin-dependent oxidoreductase [Dehalococcoidia bacterium]
MVKIATGFGSGRGWNEAVSWVLEAEKLGVDSVWTAEAWGFDAVTPLAYLAGKTEKVKLGTSIMQAGTRTPAAVAMTALTMQSLSNGRFILGLGNSGPQVIEGWHGIRFDRPVQRLREIVEIVRMAASGERVTYNGKVYQLPLPGGEGRALKVSAPPAHVPIYLATLGPKSLEVTGEIADGWLASSFTADNSKPLLDAIRRGADRAGRDFDAIERQAGGVVQFGDDLDKLIAPRKSGFAFEMGAMGSPEHNFYKDAYAMQGFGEAANRVQSLWLERKREEAAAAVPDELVVKANLLGTEAMVKDRIRAYRDAGITSISVSPAGETLGERVETLGRFMKLVGEVNAAP